MVRTQIQLPDDLYRKVQAVARAQEWSITETIRRGAEMLTKAYPQAATAKKGWQLPEPVDLGEMLVPEEKWQEVLHDEMIKRHLG